MTKTKTSDVAASLGQIGSLAEAGCEIVRLAVPAEEDARALADIKKHSPIPIIADIHFNHRLALTALEAGVDGLRLNPGNIGGRDKIKEIMRAARERKVPIRIGVNSGSVERDLLEKHGWPKPEALVESAMRHVKILEDLDFTAIKISVKASNVLDTIKAYRLLSSQTDYPLHLGVTEAGTVRAGSIKSALGIGLLLTEGIGDTIRVSLTADPVEEVRAAYDILASLGLRQRPGVEIISCPACGRVAIDLQGLVSRVEKRLAGIKKPLKISILGCVVNGPGEAREADIGIAGGDGKGVIFRKGEVVRTCKEEELEEELMKEVLKCLSA